MILSVLCRKSTISINLKTCRIMRTIRFLFAVMLTSVVFSAVQADAQSSARSNPARSSSRQTVSRSSSQSSSLTAARSRSSVSAQSSQSRQPASSVQNRNTSANRSRTSVSAQSSQNRQPAVSSQSRQPAARPSVQTQRPSAGTAVNRPASGAVNDRKPSTTVKRPAASPSRGHELRQKAPVQIRADHKHDRPRVHPGHRDFIAFDRPSHFWKPAHHYFGHRVRILPSRAVIHVHHGISYYCYNDIWYRPYGGYYVVCRPPFGTVLAADIISDMLWTAVRFSYYNTVLNTYSQINENNRYIAEQNEIIARNNAVIASQNQTIAMNQKQAQESYGLADRLGLVQSYAAVGSEYFYQDGVFYSKAASGEYNVIIPPAGALVETLPEDYEMVSLDGDDYYKVDDTVYKVTLNEGRPYFEVLGQLYS